jgi:hypothetical protein
LLLPEISVLLNQLLCLQNFFLIVSCSALLPPENRITQGLAADPEGDQQPMNRIRAASFSCTIVLAMGAFALQYGSQPPQASQGSMQPGQPSQTQPSQNPGTMQPNQPMQQPSQPQPQSSAQAGQAPSIDDQVKTLAEQLSLTPEQQAKVKTALEDQHTQAMGVVRDNTLAREDKIQKIHTIRENTIAKVRSALTSDDQKKKFDAMVQAQDDRMHQQQAPAQQPPSQQPPK